MSHILGIENVSNNSSTEALDFKQAIVPVDNGRSASESTSQTHNGNTTMTHHHADMERNKSGIPSASLIQDTDIAKDSHDFSHIYTPAPILASSRYNRQMLIPSISLAGQQRILSAKVLIIGLGGLGSPAALYLAGAGIGTLGLLDNDHVELSNLHRQVVHREDSVQYGLTKVESATRGCRELNSEIKLVDHTMRFSMDGDRTAREKIVDVVKGYDIVLDCTDNPATRYLVSDLCVLLGKTLVSGAVQRLDGQVVVLNYPVLLDTADKNGAENGVLEGGRTTVEDRSGTIAEQRGPCYRCVFPTPPSPDMVRSCGEIGILGPVVGTIGTLMATETLRLIVKGAEEVRKPTMLLYNAWPTDPRSMFRTIGLRGHRKDCLACGDEAVLGEKGLRKITQDEILEGRLDYIAFCGLLEDVNVLDAEQRIAAVDFLRMQTERSGLGKLERCTSLVVIDTREPCEVAMGPKIAKSVNIPLTRILRQDGSVEEIEALLDDGMHDSLLFVCQKGNDSQIAAQKIINMREKRVESGSKVNGVKSISIGNGHSSAIFIGDIAGGLVALEKALKASTVSPQT